MGRYYVAYMTLEMKYDIQGRRLPWYLRPFGWWWGKVSERPF